MLVSASWIEVSSGKTILILSPVPLSEKDLYGAQITSVSANEKLTFVVGGII